VTKHGDVRVKKRGFLLVVGVAFFSGVLAAEGLSPGEARRLIATVGGARLPVDNIHIRRIDTFFGRDAVVEAFVLTAFKFTRREGKWEITEVRVGDRQWESIELWTTAIEQEKMRRTADDLRTIAGAVEAYRRERGILPPATDFVGLIDHLTPTYLPRIIREDYWHRSYLYSVGPKGYRLESLGPDGKPATGDEIVIENGQMVQARSRKEEKER
jgi:hypothetical protein